MACHHLAVPFWPCRLCEVKKFTVECLHTTGGSEEMYPQDNVVCYHIPARDKFPACKCFVYDHDGLKPEIRKETEQKANRKFGEFTLFVGDKGMLGSDGHLIPQAAHERLQSAGKDAAPRSRRPDRRPVLVHPQRRHARVELYRRSRPADRHRADRPPGPVRRPGQQDRMGRRQDGLHQQAGDQPVRPPRLSTGLGGVGNRGYKEARLFRKSRASASVPRKRLPRLDSNTGPISQGNMGCADVGAAQIAAFPASGAELIRLLEARGVTLCDECRQAILAAIESEPSGSLAGPGSAGNLGWAGFDQCQHPPRNAHVPRPSAGCQAS